MNIQTLPFDIYALYASIGIVCALIIALIRNRTRTTAYRETVDGPFCRIMVFFIIFCLVDVAWGLIGSHFATQVLLYGVSTYGFHFMAAMSSFMCAYYGAQYMHVEGKWKIALAVIRTALIAVQLIFLFRNIITNDFFTIDADGVYHAGPLRPVSFILQFCQYLPVLVYAAVMAVRRFPQGGKAGAYVYTSAIIFEAIPIGFGFLQLMFPDGAFYSLGFALVTVAIYAFNVTSQREQYMATISVAEEQQRAHKQVEEALAKAEAASAAKTTFLSNMSHDIRTPINGIMGMVTLARKEEMSPAVTACVDKIDSASRHLLSLINDVLDMSRIESGRVEIASDRIDVRTLADNCRSIVLGQMEGRHLELNCRYDEVSHPRVLGDALHVRQILINILGNAVKFTPDGGHIDFILREEDYDGETVTVSFTISDTGIGMSPEFLEHVFEPFMQENNNGRTRYQGTGLGMPITKQLAEQMHGSVSVESRVGEGSTFTVRIPFREDKEEPEKVERPHETVGSFKGLRVLLVEDNELNMEIARSLLEDEGLVITDAENGRVAVDLFKNNPPGTFDIILMDLMMPEMNGFEATRAIRAYDRPDAATVPIVAMTANAFEEDRRAAMEAGMNAHVAKPIDFPTLMKEIGRLVGPRASEED